MADRDLFDLEMSPGEQPPSGLGDRFLVGIAALVLLGGAAIAVMHAVPDSSATAKASPTPSLAPSPTPVLIPTPSPPRVATVVPPDIELVQPTPQQAFSGWIRAVTDVTIVVSPVAGAAKTGVLAKGAAAYADQQAEPATEPGWLHLQDPDGWIASVSNGEEVVRRYAWAQYPTSGWVTSLDAGDHGAMAMVSPALMDPNQPLQTAPAVSGDGVTWRSGDSSAFGSWGPGALAWGPAGWLAIGFVSDGSSTGRIWIWSSPDGRRWSRLGMMAGLTTDYPTQLAGSDRGYVLLTNSQGGFRGGAASAWSSADGKTWIESTDPDLNGSGNSDLRLKATAGGFYLWEASTQPITGPRFAAFSSDGQVWRRVVGGTGGVNFQLTTIGDRTLAIDSDQITLAPRVWSGTVARGQMLWTRRPEEDPPFAGGVVTQLVNDGTRVYAFGWDRSSDRALVWTLAGGSWTRAELPASFGGIPTQAVAWPGGVVVVGHRPTLRGDNPIFWHRTPDGGWLPEANPILAAMPDPATDSCPALPSDYLDLVIADTPALIACYGATPISFRAWSATCDGCSGDQTGTAEPGWLLQPTDNQLYLNPIKVTDGGWWSNVVVSPLLPIQKSWSGAWVELTGHFDDPASATCHRQPTADELQWWTGQQALQMQCRQSFVVTAVKVVSGP
jgi:hypothetical protein